MRFDWSETARHWVPDDAFSTHVINVLHLLLPAGERWFIDIVNKARPLVRDEELDQAIKPFVQQESWHAWAHTVVLQHLADQGIDTEAYTNRLEHQWFGRLLSDHPRWPAPLQRWWLNRRLAVVAAIEHYTCVMGEWILQNDGLEKAGADPVMLDLLRWHGAEEVEHRSLVFDVHSEVGGGYLQRATTMVEVVFFLSLFWVLGVRYLMANDPSVDTKPRWRDWLRAVRQDRLPGPATLYGAAPRYLRPNHHPTQEASTEMALEYLARSPAARAAKKG